MSLRQRGTPATPEENAVMTDGRGIRVKIQSASGAHYNVYERDGYVEVDEWVRRINVTIVLGIRTDGDARREETLRRRVGKGIEVHGSENEAELRRVLVLTGGKDSTDDESSEADRMWDMARARGVALKDVVLERDATNTVENAMYTLEHLRLRFPKASIDTVTVVTSDYHIPRTRMIFRYVLGRAARRLMYVGVRSEHVDAATLERWQWWQHYLWMPVAWVHLRVHGIPPLEWALEAGAKMATRVIPDTGS